MDNPELDWRNNIVVGDTVVYDRCGELSLSKITRATPTQVVITNGFGGETKFSRRSGRIVGCDDSYSYTLIRLPTADLLEKISERKDRSAFAKITQGKMSIAQVRVMLKAFKECSE